MRIQTRCNRWPWTVILGLGLASAAGAATGFDAGLDARALVARLNAGSVEWRAGTWVRVREVETSSADKPAMDGATEVNVEFERNALGELHRRGFKICVLMLPDKVSWTGGVRGSRGAVLALDLR